jgi:hypothetical protein
MHVERFQFLSTEFEIRTNSLELLDQVCGVAPHLQQEISISHCHTISIAWTGEEFRISNGNGGEDYEISSTIVIDQLFTRMHKLALANLPDHIRLRAVTGNHAGQAFLMVGQKCSGKTTLAVHLLLAGYDVCGDELALLLDGQAVAFPRRFLVRGDCLELLPQLKSSEEFIASAAKPVRETLIGIDPIGLGKPWRLVPLDVSAFFFIEPNYGARTTIQPCGKLQMLRHIIPQCAPPGSKRANWIGDLSHTIDNTNTFMLRLGELNSAVLAIKEILG